jgi:hypothetical protein
MLMVIFSLLSVSAMAPLCHYHPVTIRWDGQPLQTDARGSTRNPR